METNGENRVVQDGNSLVFFDMEFTGLHMRTTPVSIGMCDNNGRTFYAEFTDYDEEQVDAWLIKNVIKKLSNPENVLEGNDWKMTGTKTEIARQIYFWLDPIVSSTGKVQFVSDVCHYDFVLLMDILLNGQPVINLPKFISPVCIDINQDLARGLQSGEGQNGICTFPGCCPGEVAFNISREEFAKSTGAEFDDNDKHNALHDAKVIKTIYNDLWSAIIQDFVKEDNEEDDIDDIDCL